MKTKILLLLSFAILLAGCSKEEMSQMVADAKKSAGELKSSAGEAVDKAKSAAGDAVTKAQQAAESATSLAGAAGSGTMKLDATTEFSSSYIRLVSLDGKSILQIKNVADNSPERFPAFFIQGVVDATSLDQAAGQPIACKVFAQKNGQAEIWSNLDGESVTVILSKDGSGFTAEIQQGTLHSSTTGEQIPASGSFKCVTF